MKILENMSIEEVRRHAEKPTPEPMAGEWTLTAPDGRQWKAARPTQCLIAEGNDRIPPLMQLARIRMAIEEPEQDDTARRLEVAQRLADALAELFKRGMVIAEFDDEDAPKQAAADALREWEATR